MLNFTYFYNNVIHTFNIPVVPKNVYILKDVIYVLLSEVELNHGSNV